MSKVLFAPFSLLGGIIAGIAGKKAFEGLWRVIDDQEPPNPKDRGTSWRKLVLALMLEGTVFRVVRGVTDHGARKAFCKVIGAWPGEEERPDPREGLDARHAG